MASRLKNRLGCAKAVGKRVVGKFKTNRAGAGRVICSVAVGSSSNTSGSSTRTIKSRGQCSASLKSRWWYEGFGRFPIANAEDKDAIVDKICNFWFLGKEGKGKGVSVERLITIPRGIKVNHIFCESYLAHFYMVAPGCTTE